LQQILHQLVRVGDRMLVAVETENWDDVANLDLERRGLLEQISGRISDADRSKKGITDKIDRILSQDQQIQQQVITAHQEVYKTLCQIQSGRLAQKAYSSKKSHF